MNGRLAAGMQLATLVQWMASKGVTGADLEVKGEVLLVRLPREARPKLLKDVEMRRHLVAQAKSLGFSRVALDLPLQEKE